MPPTPNDSSADRHDHWRCHVKSGSTLRPMGRNHVCYNYRATLISYRSCLKALDTFRPVWGWGRGAIPRPAPRAKQAHRMIRLTRDTIFQSDHLCTELSGRSLRGGMATMTAQAVQFV